MSIRIFVSAALLAFTLTACATTPSAERVTDVLAMEAESAARLSGEGELLYTDDSAKRNGYDYCSLAVGLIEQGELRRGIREASKALFLGQSVGDRCLLANAKRDLSVAYSFAGYLDRAQDFAEGAIQDASGCRDPWRILPTAYKVLGDVYLRRGQAKAAIAAYQQILDMPGVPQTQIAGSGGAVAQFARVSLANAYLATGDSKAATELLREAESKAADPTQLALVRRGFGRVALSQGQYSEAAKLFEQAAASAAGPDAAYHRLWALDGLARARRAAGDRPGAIAAYRQAITTAEDVRARFRSEEFKAGFFGEVQEIFDGAVAVLIEAGQADAALGVSERSRSRAFQDLLRGRVAQKAGAGVLADPVGQTVSSSELRSALGVGVVLVEYHSTAERTYAWVVRREAIDVVTIDSGRDGLAREARRFRETIRRRSPDAAALGSSLYDQLVRPLGLKEGEALVIVPHGMLHQVPFQALRGPRGYLIEERAMSYMASGSSLAELLRRARVERRQVLALGNPDLGSPRLALVGAEREVEQIKGFFPSAEIYTKKDATKERLLARAPESQLVHVAAHAQVDEIDPLYSVIRLAKSPKMPGDLEAHEVYDMDLTRTDLVALSACDSGLARVSRGDELWGFTRSFFAAGTRTLIVSLWSVEDAATAQLMQTFYDHLRRSPAHDSLRAAQVSMLQDARTPHPFFWAAFSVVGDWR